jgi:hypothetical protein
VRAAQNGRRDLLRDQELSHNGTDPAGFVGKCVTLPGAVAEHEPQCEFRFPVLTRPRFSHARGSAKRGGFGPGAPTTNLSVATVTRTESRCTMLLVAAPAVSAWARCRLAQPSFARRKSAHSVKRSLP